MNNDVSVLIYSCDNYSDVWEPFFTLFFRYWHCPYQVYITAETCKCNRDGVVTLNTTGDTWTERIRRAVENIPTDYVIGMCEDFFFRRPVRQEIIDSCVCYIKSNDNIACFNFEMCNSYTVPDKFENFGRKVNQNDYQKSCQPTLWRKEILLKLLDTNQEPWEWETSDAPLEYDYYVWTGNEDELVFEYGYHGKWFGIQKGKWVLDDVDPLFTKEGISVDYSKRGFVEEGEQQWNLEECIQ